LDTLVYGTKSAATVAHQFVRGPLQFQGSRSRWTRSQVCTCSHNWKKKI